MNHIKFKIYGFRLDSLTIRVEMTLIDIYKSDEIVTDQYVNLSKEKKQIIIQEIDRRYRNRSICCVGSA